MVSLWGLTAAVCTSSEIIVKMGEGYPRLAHAGISRKAGIAGAEAEYAGSAKFEAQLDADEAAYKKIIKAVKLATGDWRLATGR